MVGFIFQPEWKLLGTVLGRADPPKGGIGANGKAVDENLENEDDA
jgi:hypothetical protein